MPDQPETPPLTAARLGALPEFALERFFDKFEFDLPFQLGSSDPETLPLAELLALADVQTRESWATLRLGYRTTSGDPELRAAIAATYAGRGAREDGRADAWRFPIERLLEALRPGVKALVLNLPHNPTGVAATPEELRAIVAHAETLGIRVIGDEVYRGLEWAGPTPPSVTECSERAVAVGVTSKVYGLAGLRIGWVVTADAALRHKVVAIKDYTTLCAAGPSEVLATVALRAHAALLARTRKLCEANLATLDRFAADHPGLFSWARPAATTVSVAGIAASLLARHGGDPDKVFAHWRERVGVLVVPGAAFGCAPDRFRLGFGRADLAQALAAVGSAG